MFPAMNALKAVRDVHGAKSATTTGFMVNVPTGPTNFIAVPAVVDVSGMEWYIGVEGDAGSGVPSLEASTADASKLTVTLTDGGPSGDNTTVSVLTTEITNTVAYVDTVPRRMTGTTATDLDADDWVNFSVTANPTTVPAGGLYHVSLSFIYGKPASIA